MNVVIKSAVLSTVGVTLVHVEVQVSEGLPGLYIVGLADTAVYEARERVRAALKSVKVSLPAKRIVVNLAPASEKKSGSSLDVAIAIGILCAIGRLCARDFEGCICIGELSINGTIRPCTGMMAYLAFAQTQKLTLLSSITASEQSYPATDIHSVTSLNDVLCNQSQPITLIKPHANQVELLNYREVVGQLDAIQAVILAVVGHHHILLVGTPGCGKTMVATRVQTVLPDLDEQSSREVSEIYGRTSMTLGLIKKPPFREPHHSATTAGMVGGGNPFQIGEITLAHQGVLFLDELPEFRPSVLQLLRQPLESGKLTHVRAKESLTVPAQFLLFATANPCPCGYYGSNVKECTCSAGSIRQYRNRIGGPLLDRIDLVVSMASEKLNQGANMSSVMSCDDVDTVIQRSIEFRQERMRCSPEITISKESEYEYLLRQLSRGARSILESIQTRNLYSSRRILRIMRVSRTTADVAQSRVIEEEHLGAAVTYCSEWGAQ